MNLSQGWKRRSKLGEWLAVAALLFLMAMQVSRSQMPELPTSLLVVNVGSDIVRAGLSLTRIGVAEMGDQYTVGGTFIARGSKVPSGISLHLLTSTGRSITKSGPLRSAPLGNYVFLVMLPKDEGVLKAIAITIR